LKFEELDEETTRALGRLVRESWNEGPQSPSPDFLLAAIRPALAEIDRERRARPSWSRVLDRVFANVGAFLRPSPALATAAAVAFLVVTVLIPHSGTMTRIVGVGTDLHGAHASRSSLTTEGPRSVFPSANRDFQDAHFPSDGLGSIYDVSPVRRPAVLFHSTDGALTLWVIDDGDVSQRLSMGGWG
jgi:hypothetical protein